MAILLAQFQGQEEVQEGSNQGHRTQLDQGIGLAADRGQNHIGTQLKLQREGDPGAKGHSGQGDGTALDEVGRNLPEPQLPRPAQDSQQADRDRDQREKLQPQAKGLG